MLLKQCKIIIQNSEQRDKGDRGRIDEIRFENNDAKMTKYARFIMKGMGKGI